MPTCRFCGESMPAGKCTCTLCGSELPDFEPAAEAAAPKSRKAPKTPKARKTPAAPPPPAVPKDLPPGGRYCPSCGIVYDREYTDAFCICGTELQRAAPPAPVAEIVAAPPPPVAEIVAVPPPPQVEIVTRPPAVRPEPGTRCLVLIGPDRQPIQYFALAKDVTLVGRLDAPSGSFPDIDLDEWLDSVTARRVSRQHALILRSRSSGDFTLRPLPGNTGTQIETDMVPPLQDCPLAPGTRIILGGAARLRFEIT